MVLKYQHQITVEQTDPALQNKQYQDVLTLKKLNHLYIEMHAKEKKKSWKRDEQALNKYFSKYHQRKASDISKSEIVDLLQAIKKNNGPVMANRCLALIRKVYNFGIMNSFLENNPAHMVEMPAKETSRDRFYTDPEIKKLWEGFSKCWVQGEIFKMCLTTGQRVGEVTRMQ